MTTIAFPLLSGPTRTAYISAINNNEHLRHHQGTLQGLMGMIYSVPGFLGPSFIATKVLRTSAQVDLSLDHRELSPLALFAPCLAVLCYAGTSFLAPESNQMDILKGFDDEFEQVEFDERLSLLGDAFKSPIVHPTTERHKQRETIALIQSSQPQYSFDPKRPIRLSV